MRTENTIFRTTPLEKRTFKQAAEAAGMQYAPWVRQLCWNEAIRLLRERDESVAQTRQRLIEAETQEVVP